MWDYVFSGVVHPERAELDMSASLPCQIDNPEVGISGEAIVGIYKNQITVAFASATEISDWLTFRNIIIDMVSLLVDGLALNAVVGYDAEIRSIHCIQSRRTQVFGADVPGLSIKNDEKLQIDVLPLFTVGGRVHLFRRALGDFKRAIRYPVDTGFYCYRAVESLMRFVMSDRGVADKKAAAVTLEGMLNVHVDCIPLLRRLSSDPRHGKVTFVSGEDQLCALKITREILLRFSAYVQAPAGSEPKFSLLAHEISHPPMPARGCPRAIPAGTASGP
jgi:hypothetical protein